ncbi:NAD(P)-dependent oxidoreductase [Fictibacillus enclensis]|uniref:NAD-dependent epimerase/dehydratase family protein n=1 Tax=Fictibacillus enclensis TaxID=1017270 RepID=UPI0025A21E90|nr:NAD(P)-dependent oxidoreductase [Fictibacillus enclensis]MDM5198608.1 NAD(P)-dependent oxidoreductase [Fictibacillus enclensis]MDM5337811.1 NAD(P)-dependent oxidoreductase [Fictibacillus enclensis]
MKRAVVTGAAGFIGSHLCTKLLEDEIEVIGIDSARSTEKLDYIGRHANFELINEPMEQLDLKKIIKKADTVFHLACGIHSNEAWNDIENKVKQHIQSTRSLIQAIPSKSVKLIYASSYDVYGKKTGKVTETSTTNPETLFGLIKLTEENYIRMAAANHPVSYVILRFPTIYGPWQPAEMTFQQIINVNEQERDTMNIKKDSITEDAIYVDDAVRALCLAAEKGEKRTIYNIGSGTNGEWSKGLKLLSIKEEDFPKEKRNMVVVGEKAQQELGFQLDVHIEEGLKRQIQHTRQWRKNEG